jgi:hypothetical protein
MKILRVALVSAFLIGMFAMAAPAQAKGNYPPDVLGKVIQRGGSIGPKSAPNVEPAVLKRPTTQASVLPFTGADLARFVLIGFVSIGAGVVIVRRYRVAELS